MSTIRMALAALGMVAIAGPGAAEPKLLWELTGLKNPESVVIDRSAGMLYVTNADGAPATKDGNGTIAQVSTDGKLVKLDWIAGLDAPLGLALHDGRIYAADIDQLVEIDVKSSKITKRYPASGAKFLNDVAAAPDGTVYVSDMVTNTIWRLADGKFEAWLQSADLKNPNGLTVHDRKLIVAAWGTIDGENFATSVPGQVLEVSLSDKSVKPVGDGPIGNTDGIEAIDKTRFLVSDWVAGSVFVFDRASGKATKVLSFPQGTADIGYDAGTKTVFIPMMKDNRLLAYKVE